jgi:hypothetical protein
VQFGQVDVDQPDFVVAKDFRGGGQLEDEKVPVEFLLEQFVEGVEAVHVLEFVDVLSRVSYGRLHDLVCKDFFLAQCALKVADDGNGQEFVFIIHSNSSSILELSLNSSLVVTPFLFEEGSCTFG